MWPPSPSILETMGQCAAHMSHNKAQSSFLKRRHHMVVAALLQSITLSLHLFITESPTITSLFFHPLILTHHFILWTTSLHTHKASKDQFQILQQYQCQKKTCTYMSSFSKVTSPMIKLLKILRILRYLKSPYISLSFYQLISC